MSDNKYAVKAARDWSRLTDDAKFTLEIAIAELVAAEAYKHREELGGSIRREKVKKNIVRRLIEKSKKRVTVSEYEYTRDGQTIIVPEHVRVQSGQKDNLRGREFKEQASQSMPDFDFDFSSMDMVNTPDIKQAVKNGASLTQREAALARELAWQTLLYRNTPGEDNRTQFLNDIPKNTPENPNPIQPKNIQAASTAVAQLLNGTDWGQRTAAGLQLVGAAGPAGTIAQLSTAAKAFQTFGPFAGRRMIKSYNRYAGNELALDHFQRDGDNPPPTALSNTREARERGLSWSIGSLKERLPKGNQDSAEETKIPSEGYMVTREGKVINHAIGTTDDYFTPWSLGQLKSMRSEEGGALVRSRARGGITAEDLHLGMLMGVDNITVVSGSGTFSLGLSPAANKLGPNHFAALNRYQGLVREKAGNGQPAYDQYQESLEILSAEFPLHFQHSGSNETTEALRWDHSAFNSPSARDGKSKEPDYNFPDGSITSELRDLLRVGGPATAAQIANPNAPRPVGSSSLAGASPGYQNASNKIRNVKTTGSDPARFNASGISGTQTIETTISAESWRRGVFGGKLFTPTVIDASPYHSGGGLAESFREQPFSKILQSMIGKSRHPDAEEQSPLMYEAFEEILEPTLQNAKGDIPPVTGGEGGNANYHPAMMFILAGLGAISVERALEKIAESPLAYLVEGGEPQEKKEPAPEPGMQDAGITPAESVVNPSEGTSPTDSDEPIANNKIAVQALAAALEDATDPDDDDDDDDEPSGPTDEELRLLAGQQSRRGLLSALGDEPDTNVNEPQYDEDGNRIRDWG